MMAPSWFCTKKRSVSDLRAGSSRFAFLHRTEPVIDGAAMTTSRTSSVMNARCEPRMICVLPAAVGTLWM